MVLFLQSKSDYSTVLELNLTNGTYCEVPQIGDEDGIVPSKISGVFDFLNGMFVALYTLAGSLVLRVGYKAIPLVDGVEVLLSGSAMNRVLTVKLGGKELTAVRYAVSSDSSSEEDPAPCMDDEDLDFGLFIANWASDQDRALGGRSCLLPLSTYPSGYVSPTAIRV